MKKVIAILIVLIIVISHVDAGDNIGGYHGYSGLYEFFIYLSLAAAIILGIIFIVARIRGGSNKN